MTAEFPLAVHALVFLLHRGDTISSGELAENICTNPARVRKVMAKLHRAGLVESCRGQGSGYRLAPEGAALPLSRVLAALGEEAIDMNWRSGDLDRDCLICSGMGAVMDGVYGSLNAACRRELDALSVGALCERLFAP